MNPYAIVETGGKQLRMEPNQLLGVERVKAGKAPKEVVFDKVLLAQKGETFKVGNPYVKGASVLCEYVGEIRGPKTVIFKMKRRKNYRRKRGHRQTLTEVRVKEIQFQE
jgi:large subunit ribosomal protein L21